MTKGCWSVAVDVVVVHEPDTINPGDKAGEFRIPQELQDALPTEIASAEAVVEEIQARLEYSKDNFERLENLRKTGGGVLNINGASRQQMPEDISWKKATAALPYFFDRKPPMMHPRAPAAI